VFLCTHRVFLRIKKEENVFLCTHRVFLRFLTDKKIIKKNSFTTSLTKKGDFASKKQFLQLH
jgi:hypothetical protein